VVAAPESGKAIIFRANALVHQVVCLTVCLLLGLTLFPHWF